MLRLCEKYDLRCITNLRSWAKKPSKKNAKKPWTFERPLPPHSASHWGFVRPSPLSRLVGSDAWPSSTLVGVAQYLVDEPNADEYAGLATTVAKIRSQVSKFE